MDRRYFFELGAYDPGLQIWGGENFELSFKESAGEVNLSLRQVFRKYKPCINVLIIMVAASIP